MSASKEKSSPQPNVRFLKSGAGVADDADEDARIERSMSEAYALKSQKTLANYLHRLKSLKALFPGKRLRWILLEGPIENRYRKIRERYPNVSTRKNMLTAALVALRHFPEAAASDEEFKRRLARWREFHEHMGAFENAQARRRVPSARQMAQYTTMEEIEDKYRALLSSNEGGGAGGGHAASRDASQTIVLLSIIASTPPKRSDYGSLRVVPDERDAGEGENVLVAPDDPARRPYIVLRKYKTSDVHGQVVQELPLRTARDVRTSLRLWPREHLFESRLGRPFASNDGFSKYVRGVFRNLFGRSTGTTMLRHIYVTEKIDYGSMDDDDLEEVARQMLHSTGLQRRYQWDRKKICAALSSICPECRAPGDKKTAISEYV